jgi:capsular exopolysaccharide synthesis family protein
MSSVNLSADSDAMPKQASGGFSEELVALSDPAGVVAEAYRTLRTNLLYALVDYPPKVIVVTSPGLGEGKSATCANLAVMLAQADKSTTLVDCDLRRPSLHKLFGVLNTRGLVNLLAGEHSLESVAQEPLDNLKVITSGSLPPNPAELLGSQRFADFLEQTRRESDYVLIDAPPIHPVADPAIIATQGDGVLMVVDSQGTRRTELRRSLRNLEAVNARVLGIVVNKVQTPRGSYYQYS